MGVCLPPYEQSFASRHRSFALVAGVERDDLFKLYRDRLQDANVARVVQLLVVDRLTRQVSDDVGRVALLVGVVRHEMIAELHNLMKDGGFAVC